VGSSFIGMETASCIAKKAKSIVVIGMENVPFERVLGERIGTVVQKLFEKNNISFRMKRVVKEFRGLDRQVRNVLLDNGEQLDADLCIVGARIIPATKYIKGVKIERDQSVVCDEYLQAGENLYAGGDICRFPWWFLGGESVRVEHWGEAQYHGKVAAANMAGKKVAARNIPFFWTQFFGKTVRYCGHALAYDEIYVDGDIENFKFAAYYIKHDKILAVASMGMDPLVSAVAELMQHGRMPSAKEVKDSKIDLIKRASGL